MGPRIWIAEEAWALTRRELDRVHPHEGLAVPLVSLTPADPAHNPCGPLRLAGLESVLIAEVLLLPSALQANRPARVHALADADRTVDVQVQQLVRARPRLRAAAYLHSHPFARGRTSPSGSLLGPGDWGDIDGHMRPLLRRNRAAGLELSLSFIACRRRRGPGWKLQAFALVPGGAVLDLGFAEAVPTGHPAVRRAALPALDLRHPQRCWLRRWRRELDHLGLAHRQDELFDGWWRFIARRPDGGRGVLLVPLDFPGRPLRFFHVDPAGRTREVLPAGVSAHAPAAPGAFFGQFAQGVFHEAA